MQNVTKVLVLEHFGALREVDKNTLYNLSFMEPFGTIFAKWPQNYQKGIRFSLKVDGVLRLREMLEKSILERRKKLTKIPYKTCRTLIILVPKTQNGFQNDQKALGFHYKSHGIPPCRNTL